MLDEYTLLGLFAGFLTTVSFLPQVVKTWRSRSARDISLGMFLILVSGVALWLIYGLLIKDLAVILTNAFTLVMSGSILFFKLKYRKKDQK